MRLLIADFARRRRWTAVYVAIAMAAMWWMCAEVVRDASRAMGLSMGCAFMFGPFAGRYLPPVIWYLPVSRRDVWRATWLAATVGATTLTALPKLIAMVIPAVRDTFGLGPMLLSCAYDFACTGIGCGLAILATSPERTSGSWRRMSAVVRGSADAALPLGMMVPVFLGGFWGRSGSPGVLPSNWSDLTVRGAAILVAAICLTIATYFHSPAPQAPGNRSPVARREQRRAPLSFRVFGVFRGRLQGGGLAGLPRLLVHEYAWTAMTGGALVAGSLLAVAFLANLMYAEEGALQYIRTALLVFDGTIPPPPGGGYQAVIVLTLFACFAATLTARLSSTVRHLRMLPLSAARVNVLLAGWPAVIWLTVWTAWLATHVAIVGNGVTSFKPALFVALVGASALVRAIGLRFTGAAHALGAALSLAVVPIMLFVEPLPWEALVMAGACGLAGAAGLNHEALRRSATYKHA